MPQVSLGFLSLTGKTEDQHPVTVLSDTASSQSLILSGVLRMLADSACDVSAVVRSIKMGFVSAPPHVVHIKCKLLTGLFPVGACFPINGVYFIMGDDIAGG